MEGGVLGDFGVDCSLDVAGHSIILILLPGRRARSKGGKMREGRGMKKEEVNKCG